MAAFNRSKLSGDPFSSELNWPFTIRVEELLSCLDFLSSDIEGGPKFLNLVGSSGCGKSFFARELIAKYSQSQSHLVALYVDVFSADLEASRFFQKFKNFLGKPRVANRESPVQIPHSVFKSWRLRNSIPKDWRAYYAYRVIRDLVGQIPLIGPFLKMLMPSSISMDGLLDQSPEAAFRYLIKLSRGSPVVLAIDNIQFLSEAMRSQIEAELREAGSKLRLLLIERLDYSAPVNWVPSIDFVETRQVRFDAISRKDVLKIVKKVLGKIENLEQLSGAIHRRSNGNLKSIWFQLKLAAHRQTINTQENLPSTYEEVITSLNPSDQVVLRLIVFLLGGLTVTQLGALFQSSVFGFDDTIVAGAVSDLMALGLLVINSDSNDRVKIEHEIISQIVSEITPEEEKLELRRELVLALDSVLNEQSTSEQDSTLYDRLFGITDPLDVKQSPSIQSHIVRFLSQQNDEENYTYLSTLLRDSVCWETLDILPSHSVKILMNSLQKCSLFSFGLVASEKLKGSQSNKELGYLYEAKFLVQLFRYTDARAALENVPDSAERRLVQHNMLLGQSLEAEARKITEEILRQRKENGFSEFDAVILRNSAHLFRHAAAQKVMLASVGAFRKMGSKFGTATALNNLGVSQISAKEYISARVSLSESLKLLQRLGSTEAYQPHVNISALELKSGNFDKAKEHLCSASELLPNSLIMDDLMISANFIVIRSVEANELDFLSFEELKNLQERSRKTGDRRFINTLEHLIAALETLIEHETNTEYSEEIMSPVLDLNQSGMELYFDIRCANATVKVPYFLSPHWRY